MNIYKVNLKNDDSYFIAAESEIDQLKMIEIFQSEIDSIEYILNMNQVMVIDSLINEKKSLVDVTNIHEVL